MKKMYRIADCSILILTIGIRRGKTRRLPRALAMGAPYDKNIAMARANIPIFYKRKNKK